jgi:ubiquinone/menaquinone biosynthesis C-methylase UbiE
MPEQCYFAESVWSAIASGVRNCYVVLSSLFFRHLSTNDKVETLMEMHRVLQTDGELHVVDWTNVLMRIAFLPVQVLHGFDTTHDSVIGALPGFNEKCRISDQNTFFQHSSVCGEQKMKQSYARVCPFVSHVTMVSANRNT